MREKETERERVGERDATFNVEKQRYIIGYGGSQAVPACPSGKDRLKRR
jgi:hypothetical protein